MSEGGGRIGFARELGRISGRISKIVSPFIEFFSLCERLGCEEDLKKVFSFQDVPTSLAIDIVGEGLRKMISR